MENCVKIFVKTGLEIHNAHPKTKATGFPIRCQSLDRLQMNIRSLAQFKCRCCGAAVEADAGRCYSCGVAYPMSELRAVALSLTAIPFYLVAVLALITLWFL